MIKSMSVLLAAGLLVSPILGWAQSVPAASSTTTSTVKVEELKKSDEKQKDIDNEITDARMRASLGSKSKWSLKMGLDYSGSSIDDPFYGVRPNYRASATTESMTSLSGTVGINLRTGQRDNWTFSTGVSVTDPLHGNIFERATDTRKKGKNRSIPRTEVSTPSLGWSRGYRLFDTQMMSSASYQHATDSESVDQASIGGAVSLGQTFLADFGKSGWNGGTSVSLGKTLYSGSITDPDYLSLIASGSYKRTEVSGGIFPFLQYTFNDRYSFRTVFGYFQFARYEGENENTWLEPYQSVGVGIAVTRDIYLYPNVQFTPKDIRGDRTNVALSTNINIF